MDGSRFDALVRGVAAAKTRRALLLTAALSAAGAILPVPRDSAAKPGDVSAAACMGMGTRCGRRNQPPCNRCCTNYSTKPKSGQRRCACRPDGQICRRDDECCGGLCCVIDGQRLCLPGFLTGGVCPEDDCSCLP